MLFGQKKKKNVQWKKGMGKMLQIKSVKDE